MELPHLSAVVATMLEWVLSDRDISYELTERYFLHLHEKAEARKKVENGENKNDQTTIFGRMKKSGNYPLAPGYFSLVYGTSPMMKG